MKKYPTPSTCEIDISKLIGYNPNWSNHQQYIVGMMKVCRLDGGHKDVLWLLTEWYPPQIAPISDDCRFYVFGPDQYSCLMSVWHHSSLYHKSPLYVYTLNDISLLGPI
jgi:hypothetical protein